MEYKFSNAVVINPKESLKKGTNAKKIAMADIQENYRFIKNFELNKFKSGTKFRNGDTLFARITPCLENGKIAQVNILEESEVAFGSTEFLILRDKEGVTISDYVYYLSKWDYIKDSAIKSMTGTSGRQRVQNSIFDELAVDIPSIETQKSIVSVLNNLDYKIEINNKIIENLEAQAQAIFKSWFVDFEPFQDGNFVESELGLIPEGWDIKELKNIVEYNKRGFSPKYTVDKSGIPVINQRCIRNSRIIDEAVKYHDPTQKKVPSDKYYQPYDVLINSMGVGTLGRVSQVSKIEKNKIVHSCITILRANTDVIKPAIFGQMMIRSQKLFEIIGEGTTGQTSLKNKDIDMLSYIIPPIDVQDQIESVLDSILRYTDELYMQNQTLALTRDTLLPKLMSGEIDVSDIKIDEDIDYD